VDKGETDAISSTPEVIQNLLVHHQQPAKIEVDANGRYGPDARYGPLSDVFRRRVKLYIAGLKLKQAPGAPAVSLTCVCGNEEVVPDRPGAPANPVAKEHKPQPIDKSDNARSLGFVLRFGDWRFLDLGDLTWNIEYKLVHPSDKIGPVDVFQVTHHGLEISNNPVLLKTVRPRVAIYSNGPRKGCHPSVTATLRRLPDLQAIYQQHRNLTAGDAENTDPGFIANAPRSSGEMIYLQVAADAKSYTVRAGSKGKPKTYSTRGTEPR